MALGVIPPLCATLGPVLAGPEGCSRGPVALRALEVASYRRSRGQGVREHHAPVGALRLVEAVNLFSESLGSGSTTHLQVH